MQNKTGKYNVGNVLPDGRKILDKKRTGKTDYQFLLFCNTCKTKQWVKRAGGLRRECSGCYGKIWKYESQKDRVANKSFTNYRYRARKRGYEFSLTRTEFLKIINQSCYWCGFSGKVGVDRLDNKKGYTTENSVPSCKICNYAKNDMTVQEWEEWINRMIKHNNRKDYV